MKKETTNAIMWLATAVAVITGLALTKNPNCLWAMFIPALVMKS